ncbi:hypothetical protein [Planctomicrobium piriforme]|uniref:Uncharacterized protein n=1 Tax=Planctomicrobium piriforme TaxID=1576369 RepID=A0A1I3E3Q7_9PLAN|nr:hypothetical protein [Planctomicrobium piriforme]SFH93614.1 hypothetical protein SAMN05421753_10468 [Planctomicrobium piriforme]
MSEQQIVAFRAIDRPVSKENLKYMRQQSTRAEITPWAFDNEYEYGDFRGNKLEMLRRGYDLHLHTANFGIRTLMIRLPHGLPNHSELKRYLLKNGLAFLKDNQGPGGCLCIEPCYEPGELEDIWEIDELLERLIPVRAELMNGDLRPLYLAHLAVAGDNNHDPDEMLEAPVPAGLGSLSKAQQALAEFYCLSEDLIAAAAMESLPLPASGTAELEGGYAEWVRKLPTDLKNDWLTALLNDSDAPVRAEMLTRFRDEFSPPAWPTSPPRRTITELHAATDEIAEKREQRTVAKTAKDRKQRLAKMAADPSIALRESERLVAQRTGAAYRQAAELLADLREALAGSDQSGLAEKQAHKLKNRYPKLHLLTGELRKRGFVPK